MPVFREALVAVAVVCLFGQAMATATVPDATPTAVDPALSPDASYVARWVSSSRDNKGKPYVIVDKKDARVFVFGPRGAMLGATPALLGMARGDHSVPGVGAMLPSRIPLADRTTPAGRFESEPGINLD